MHPLIDSERQKLAKRYRRDERIISVVLHVISVLSILILLIFNLSETLVVFLRSLVEARIFVIFFYFVVLYVVYSIVAFPLNYIASYKIEHKYQFSTQSFKAWFVDWLKSFVVSFILGVIIFEVIYLITIVAQNFWWLWLSIIMIIFSVVLANLFPVLILPLFYKTMPLEDDDLRKKIKEICAKMKIDVKEVFTINLSSKSTKANAAVVGLGNTKRILLGDTFINDYTKSEILSVLAHEITHYHEYHIWWLVLWQSLVTLAMFYVFSLIYPYVYNLAGYEKISDLAAFPLFALIFSILSFFFKPLNSAISRYYEKKADKGTLDLTQNPEGFISVMAKFCNKQLSIAYPHPLIEWYKYSHPSPGKRIKFAEKWQENHKA